MDTIASGPTTVLSQFTYSYDPDNNSTTTGTDGKRYRATEKTRVQPAVGPAELKTSEYLWTYDGAGRMVREVLDHWDNSLDHTEDYLYDLVGNRVKKTTDNPNTAGVDSVTTYTYNQNDQAIAEFVDLGGDNVAEETISYTWQGTQQTSKTTTVNSVNVDTVQFVYNLRGQLSRVTTETRNASNQLTKNTQVNYRYDIAGIRNVELSYNDVNLDGSFAANEKSGSISYTINHRSMTGVAEVLIETHRDGDDNLVKRVSYTFAEDELTQTTTEYNPANGQQTSKTTLTFGHGSVRAVFGASAALLQAFTYAAYAELLAVHSTTGQSVAVAQALTRMLYSGEATDPNTGMQYLRARWYDTNSGRFATLDPHGGVFENPLTMNKYAYTSGDPISYNDPTGEFEGLAGMMGSMGNMMMAYGSRISSGLRMMKLARNLQKYVKIYQKLINLVEKVENFASLAQSITDFITNGIGFEDLLRSVYDDALNSLGVTTGTGTTAVSDSLSARAASARSRPIPGVLYTEKIKTFNIRKLFQRQKLNTYASAGISVVKHLGQQLMGKDIGEVIGEYGAEISMQQFGFKTSELEMEARDGGKDGVSEVIGEYGAWIVMDMMGYNTRGLMMHSEHAAEDGLTLGNSLIPDRSGIDIVARRGRMGMWAIVEAKGTGKGNGKWGTLSKIPTGYGLPMTYPWIDHNMKKITSINTGSEGIALKAAWGSKKMLAAVVATRYKNKKWEARIIYQKIQTTPSNFKWDKAYSSREFT